MFYVEIVQKMTKLINKDTYRHKHTEVWKMLGGAAPHLPVVPPLITGTLGHEGTLDHQWSRFAPSGNPGLNERIKTRTKHLENVNIYYSLCTFFTFKLLRCSVQILQLS